MNVDSLAGKVILITGAGRGAGRLLAEGLAAQGALIAANDLTPINIDPLIGQIRAQGGSARGYMHDIAKKVDVQAMINRVQDDFGRIDVLINCANVMQPSPLLQVDEWDLHRVFEVNAIGTLLVTQSAARVMRTQGGGLIINCVKIPPEAPASYIASRAGFLAITETLNRELNPYNIKIHAIPAKNPLPELLSVFGAG